MKNVVPGTCWAGYIHVHHVPGISGTHVQYMYSRVSLPPGDGILWFLGHCSGCPLGCWSQNWIVIVVHVHGLLTSLWFLCIINCFGSEKMESLLLNILHLPVNGTRFTIIPRKFLQSAKEFGCYTIMCVVIYLSSQANCK